MTWLAVRSVPCPEVRVALPACDRCGNTNPREMIGLMTLWFGSFVDRMPDHGYFYLCPPCYDRWIKPHFDQVQGRLAELHPAGHQLDLHGRADDAWDGAQEAPPPATEPRANPESEFESEPHLESGSGSGPATSAPRVAAGESRDGGTAARGGG